MIRMWIIEHNMLICEKCGDFSFFAFRGAVFMETFLNDIREELELSIPPRWNLEWTCGVFSLNLTTNFNATAMKKLKIGHFIDF